MTVHRPGWMRSARVTTLLERVAIGVASLAVSIGAIALLSGFFAGQDAAGVSSSAGPGLAFADLGHSHLRAGDPPPAYNSDPPTSGPHVPVPVTRDETSLSNDQLLEALELGDVVIMYGTRSPPPGLLPLADRVASPFTPALAASGQAVIVSRRRGTVGLIGLAWAHMIRVSAPNDSLLGEFASFWLGRGAPGR